MSLFRVLKITYKVKLKKPHARSNVSHYNYSICSLVSMYLKVCNFALH